MLPGAYMTMFPGVPDASDRADIIAYLKTFPHNELIVAIEVGLPQKGHGGPMFGTGIEVSFHPRYVV